MRNLKVKFDSTTAINIMKGNRGTALQLLLQLRMALEKVYPQTDIAVIRSSNSNIIFSIFSRSNGLKQRYGEERRHQYWKNG